MQMKTSVDINGRKKRKMKTLVISILLSVISLLVNHLSAFAQYNYEHDVIPDEGTAIRIAEAIWLPIWGKEIYKQKPFCATLRGDTAWLVYSTNKKAERKIKRENKGIPRDQIIAVYPTYGILLRKKDCTVLYIGKSK